MTSETDQRAAKLKQAQGMMQDGRLAEADTLLDGLLQTDPSDVEALYTQAVCKRYLGQLEAAETALARLQAASPEFGRAYQEEGHLRKAQGRIEDAVAAFERAVRFNPALIASWRALDELYTKLGGMSAASTARAQAERLASLPRDVVAVTHLLSEGKLLKAEQLCRAFLQKNQKHVEAMRLLAEIGSRFGVLDDADFLLESAAEFEPDNIQVRLDWIQILRKRQKFTEALAESRALYERQPDNPVFQSHYAIECMQTGDYEKALELFDSVLAKLPDDAPTLTSKAHALKTAGRTEDAIAAYRAAIAAKPDHGDAWYGLANLKTFRFDAADIQRMEAEEAGAGLLHADRVHLCFALGKAHEDAGDHQASFRYYERANALKKAQSRYTSEQMDEEFEAQKRYCTPALFESQGGQGCEAPDPIFIVGLPRAGSTLIEQILASHSQVDGTLELPDILSLAHRLRGRNRLSDRERYPRILGELDAGKLREMGEHYIESTRIHRQGAPFFTDKMPNNFRHIGLIKLILPNAKIIDARRDPMDCCFSGFKQNFAEGQEFTYGLEEIGRYYRGYVDLMEHWDRVLPGEVLRVQYEDVVADLESQVRRMLDFLGLPFEQACLDFHQTDRAVRTASSEQVRQPIYRSGMEQWRPFEPWLDPLKDALGPDLAPRQEGAA